MGTGGPDLRQVNGVDALTDQPPQRGCRGDLSEHVLTLTPQLANPVDTIGTVGDRGDQIARTHPRAQ